MGKSPKKTILIAQNLTQPVATLLPSCFCLLWFCFLFFFCQALFLLCVAGLIIPELLMALCIPVISQ